MTYKVQSEMTGIIWKILIEINQQVEKNQEIMILESMKMEIPILSPYEGRVKEILVKENDFVSEGDIIIVLE